MATSQGQLSFYSLFVFLFSLIVFSPAFCHVDKVTVSSDLKNQQPILGCDSFKGQEKQECIERIKTFAATRDISQIK